MMSDNRLTLENDFLRVAFVRHGAELQEVYSKSGGIDLLWSGDPAYWGKHSPILFPIVGALKDNEYIYRDERYMMGRHGFARDMEFEVVIHDVNSIEFRLGYNVDTLRIYPFQFELRVRYELEDAVLTCVYKVVNVSSAESLFFSIGAHPAFAVPMRAHHSYRNYYIEFDRDTVLERYPLTLEGLLYPTPEAFELEGGKLHLSNEVFYKDALVFKNFKSKLITLGSSNEGLKIEMNIEDFPYLGIWAAKDAPFVCLEPWLGIADSLGHNKNLESKEGIIQLEPGSESVKSWNIIVKDDEQITT